MKRKAQVFVTACSFFFAAFVVGLTATRLRRKQIVPDKYAADAHTWWIWAENMYAAASVLFDPQRPGLWFGAAQLGALALEAFLKAALIRNGHTVVREDVWGHDLPKLAKKLASEIQAFPPEIIANVRVFSNLFEELRYPSALKRVKGLGEYEGELLTETVKMLRPYAKD